MAQNDSASNSGTIKVSKGKAEDIYIRSYVNFRYEIPLKYLNGNSDYSIFQPFPVVDGYPFPFNYTKYFNNKFLVEKADLKDKLSDTVKIEINISAKGKVSYQSKIMNTNNILNTQSLNFLKQIKEWYPGYLIIPERGTFKKQTVIKPHKVNLASNGIITIIFSKESFDN
jgi:hypothetical protein